MVVYTETLSSTWQMPEFKISDFILKLNWKREEHTTAFLNRSEVLPQPAALLFGLIYSMFIMSRCLEPQPKVKTLHSDTKNETPEHKIKQP